MTLEELYDKVRKWDQENTGSTVALSYYTTILNHLYHQAKNEWRVYLPAEHPGFNSSYMERLASWVGNAQDEAEQKLLLEYALHISFFSHDDFVALYRTAFNREIKRWVATQIGARLDTAGAQRLNETVQLHIHQRTWFCPVTDSMDINEFYKVNHLKGIGHRPGFATLHMLAKKAKVPDPGIATNINFYMSDPNLDSDRPHPALERIVLLEDVVGSGVQCLSAIRWAVENLAKPVLFIPLILCPNGVEALTKEVQRSAGRLTVRPVIELSRNDLLGRERKDHPGWKIAGAMEKFARGTARTLGIREDQAFGFKETGCSLATFANTPDNSLPIIHHKPRNGNWQPLFPRVHRD